MTSASCENFAARDVGRIPQGRIFTITSFDFGGGRLRQPPVAPGTGGSANHAGRNDLTRQHSTHSAKNPNGDLSGIAGKSVARDAFNALLK
jgi:hypothetical protein